MAYVSQELKKELVASSDFDLLCDFVEQNNIEFDFDIPNNRYKIYRKTFRTPKAALDYAKQQHAAIRSFGENS